MAIEPSASQVHRDPVRWEISRAFRFEAAHSLPGLPDGHKCRRLHGHSFRVEVWVGDDNLLPEGWVCDFADIDQAFDPLLEELDHQHLNEIDGLENPTSEVLAAWIWSRLAHALPGLIAVEVAETCRARCIYRGP
jgi:6-pyruvoyltetrahydropterin/6-carboxytetrahydropterin synthase